MNNLLFHSGLFKAPPQGAAVGMKPGGDFMYSNTDLQFLNKFMPKTALDLPGDQIVNYKKHRDAIDGTVAKRAVKSKKQQRRRSSESRKSEGGENDDKKPFPRSWKSRSYATRRHKIFIDSKHRDQVKYPDASNFVISWGKTIQNVVSLRLNSLEFPNVMQSVSTTNNVFAWINLEDIDLDPPFPVYSVIIPPGSYSLDTLNTEMTNDLKIPFRHHGEPDQVTGAAATHHYFMVETSDDTDYVGFTSIIARAAPTDPIRVVANSATVIFSQPNHGYRNGETIYILGVVGYIGGLQSVDMTGGFVITFIDADSFSFLVLSTAKDNATGGGILVRTGRVAPFQFLAGTVPNSIADVLGFPTQNSGVSVAYTDPIQTKTLAVVQVLPRGPVTDIVAIDHGLMVGDVIYLHNFFVSPSIYENDRVKGSFRVVGVPSPDKITIQYAVQHISDISKAIIGTRIFKLTFPGHNFNRIMDISQTSAGVITVTTLFDHNYDAELNKGVRLTNTNCVPAMDGYHVMTITGPDTFTIAGTLISPGFSGILLADHDFYLYNVQPFGGFSSNELNNTRYTIREVLSDAQFTYTGNYGFSNASVTGGGSLIKINSKLHGWSGTQANTFNSVLYKPVKLSGENYAFMCIPGINTDDCIATTSQVKNIFAKIFLTTTPGVVIFNEFDSLPVELAVPIPKLDQLQFTIVTPDGAQASFNGLDYSFGLELTLLDIGAGAGAAHGD